VSNSGLGCRVDHFIGYFVFTLTFYLAWPRPFAVGGALVALALLLESLQAFMPDCHADLKAALISASGAMAAILRADFLIRAPRRLGRRTLLMLARAGLPTPPDPGLVHAAQGMLPKSPLVSQAAGSIQSRF
jgi:hypothetical protein